jgi:hypothetical protein
MVRDEMPVFKPYNPLDKYNLGASVANVLLNAQIQHLPPDAFVGAGVYVLYYTGSFTAYQKLSEVNRNGQFKRPIYAGPAGARKGYQTRSRTWTSLV